MSERRLLPSQNPAVSAVSCRKSSFCLSNAVFLPAEEKPWSFWSCQKRDGVFSLISFRKKRGFENLLLLLAEPA